MALIRGVQGLFPCPICLIPTNELGNIHISACLRNMEETMRLVSEGDEEKLKAQGLQPVKVLLLLYLPKFKSDLPNQEHILDSSIFGSIQSSFLGSNA